MVRKKCFSPYIRCHFPRAKLLLFDKTYNSVMCIMLPSKSTPIYVYDPNVINVNYNYYYLTFTLDYTTFVKLKVGDFYNFLANYNMSQNVHNCMSVHI